MHDALTEWLADPAGISERPDPWQAAVDHLLSTLRHIDGTDQDDLIARTGYRIRSEVVAELIDGSLLQRDGSHLRLTPSGWPLADGITWRLCEALVRSSPLHRGSA